MTTQKHCLLRGLTALSLIAPLASFANPAAFENGFYVGAKIGGQQAMASSDNSSSVFFRDFDDFPGGEFIEFTSINPDQDGQAYHTNLMGNVAVGYARIVEQFFLAAELSVNLATEQEFSWEETGELTAETAERENIYFINPNINSEVTIENPDIIFDLRPGLLLAKNLLLYGRIGVAFNELSIEQEGTATYSNSTDGAYSFPISSSEEKDVAALRVGLGMEYKLTHNLGINMDYVFTDYGNIDTEFASTEHFRDEFRDGIFAAQTTSTAQADVTKSTATVGFNWYFGGKKHKPAYHGPDK